MSIGSIAIESVLFDSTVDLVKQFIKLRQSKKEEELQTDEWTALEKAYSDHLKWRFGYPKKVFNQQLYTRVVLSVVVILLILSGLAFSFWQLKYAMEVGDFSNLNTDISIETAGKISMNSSIIGAVVLIISLAFFSLYLKNVFTIQHETPPHVGFDETDLKDKIRTKLFGRSEKKDITDFNSQVYKYLLEDYVKRSKENGTKEEPDNKKSE